MGKTDENAEKKEIFWLDKWEGKSMSGYYYRCDLFKFFENCKNNGLKVVGIVKPKDWNIEFIVEQLKKEKE